MLTCPPTSSMDLVLGTLVLRPYVFGFVACFLVAGALDLGWRRTLVFAGWVWPLVWAAEFASTRVGVPFGFYHYTGTTRGRELYVADAPLIDSLSFTFLAYAAFSLARGVLSNRAGAWPLAATGGVLMMLLDVVIDPIAVRCDRWFLGRIFYYVEEGAYFGVPLVYFAGSGLLGTLAIGGSLIPNPDGPGNPPEPGMALFYTVLAVHLAVTAWIREWGLLGHGLLLSAGTAAVLYAVRRRPAVGPGMESQKA